MDMGPNFLTQPDPTKNCVIVTRQDL